VGRQGAGFCEPGASRPGPGAGSNAAIMRVWAAPGGAGRGRGPRGPRGWGAGKVLGGRGLGPGPVEGWARGVREVRLQTGAETGAETGAGAASCARVEAPVWRRARALRACTARASRARDAHAVAYGA
jgi:hypothetical protein